MKGGVDKDGELPHIDDMPGPSLIVGRLKLCNIGPTSLELNPRREAYRRVLVDESLRMNVSLRMLHSYLWLEIPAG